MTAKTGWGLLILLSLVPAGAARAADPKLIDSTWLARLKTEGKAAYEASLQKFQALSLRLEMTQETRSDKVPGGKGTSNTFQPHTRRERYVRLADNSLMEKFRVNDGSPDRPQIHLECDNADYFFTLWKAQDDSEFALTEYSPGSRKLPLIKQNFGLLPDLWLLAGNVFAAIENEGKYTLRGLQFDAAKQLLRADYTLATKDGGVALEASVYLDPDHDWRVVELHGDTPAASFTTRWTYGIVVEGLEFCNGSKSLYTYKVADAPSNYEAIVTVLSLKTTTKTPDDFRLAAFGFPEPVDVTPRPKPTPWYVWIGAAAGGCAVLAAAFAYAQRRRQARRSGQPIPGAIL